MSEEVAFKPETYKVKFPFNGGRDVEHLWVESQKGQDFSLSEENTFKTIIGTMSSLPLIANFDLMEFLRENRGAHLQNDDGTYYTEMQLREEFHTRCKLPLPGDTIHWRYDGEIYRVMKIWKPATEDELVERGWHKPNSEGHLVILCGLIRNENPDEWKEEPHKAHYQLWGYMAPPYVKGRYD
mmetsp:Transcript_15372/g.33430  ORF Transcript_15372/g.33430 Transcript_15372/m.33430 type:complete len:183 (-) Transcript_15372:220-768(-)